MKDSRESDQNVLTSMQEGVLLITIHRPAKKNALTVAMYAALADILSEADRDGDIRVLLFCGAGDSFSSGNDLKDFLASPPTGEASPVFRFMKALAAAEKPMVAAVKGNAVGIGTTMLLHCDLVYAAGDARFQLPFVNLGLCPEAASSFLLPYLAGYQRAAEALLLGEPFGAHKACEMGLVNEVCPDGTLMDRAWERARKLASQPAASVRLTKAMLKRAIAGQISETMAREVEAFVQRLGSPEAHEAIGAFFERRKPDFSRFK
jgi:enoyl-CoA hydratase/carnithine racemase